MNPAKRNLRLSPVGGHTVSNYLGDKICIQSSKNTKEEDNLKLDCNQSVKKSLVTIYPKEWIGKTFLKDSEEDAQSFLVCVVHAVIDKENKINEG
jgi:hypothetical protein